LETQNVELDENGIYTVLLGSSSNEGLPLDLFASGEARWLGLQVQGQAEQPRVLLVAVPYALRAEEAQRLAGREASEFLLAEQMENDVQQVVETKVEAELEAQGLVLTEEGVTPAIVDGASTFTDNNTTQVVQVTQNGTGKGLKALSTTGNTVEAESTGTSGTNFTLLGINRSTGGRALFGFASATSGATIAAAGRADSPLGIGFFGQALSTTGPTVGVQAEVRSANGIAGLFANTAGGTLLLGKSAGTEVFSVDGNGNVTAGGLVVDSPTLVVDVVEKRVGIGTAAPETELHVAGGTGTTIRFGSAESIEDAGVFIIGTGGNDLQTIELFTDQRALIGTSLIVGELGPSGNDLTVKNGNVTLTNGNVSVAGNLDITGTLTKGGGAFKIDHPLDPADKYLSHSFVESPDMKNVYDGVVELDRQGEAVVTLPAWFEALNRDFRYQLTPIGGFAPVYIAQEIQNSRFLIAGGQPGMKISWQVTGIRQDAYANAHRIPVEEEKPLAERGYYLHPEVFGQPRERSIASAERAAAEAAVGQPPGPGASEAEQAEYRRRHPNPRSIRTAKPQ
jgi:hypothetical protein